MRGLRGALELVFGLAIGWAARISARKAGLALVYHRLGERPGDRRLELDPAVSVEAFERQLRHLRRCYRVVPASELLDAVRRRRRGKRFPVAITFDDDLDSHSRLAARALRRAGLPATFFLCGRSLQGPMSFWWEDLQAAVDRELLELDALPGLPKDAVEAARDHVPQAIHRVAGLIERMSPDQRVVVAAKLRDLVGPQSQTSGLSADNVRALAQAGFEIGFHTLRHDLLVALDDESLVRAMRDGLEQLAEAAGQTPRLLAYPHGKADTRVAAAARAAGFALGFTGLAQTIEARTDPYLIARYEAPAVGGGAFALWLARAVKSSRSTAA